MVLRGTLLAAARSSVVFLNTYNCVLEQNLGVCSTKPSFFCPHLHTINANMLSYVNYRTFSLASHLFIENGKEKEPAVCRMLKEAWSMRVKVLKADYISTYLQQSMKAEDEQKYVVKKFS